MTPSDQGAGLAGADTTLVRRWNRRTVLSTLRAHPEVTLSTMAKLTGLSRPTLSAVLEELTERGLVQAHAPATGGSGRPARRYGFRATAGYALGLHFSPARVLALATDLDGRITARGSIDVPSGTSAPDRLEAARTLAERTAAQAGPVWAVGAATTGVVDPEGRVLRSSQISGWTGLDLVGTVSGWFGCAAVAGNDGTLAALGEKWQGVARYADDVALILSGKVGSSIASEIGTMRITEQIDALEIMGVNSASYLILPKIVAAVLFFPFLTILSIGIGVAGGWMIAWATGIMIPDDYIEGLLLDFKPYSIVYSLIKTAVFAYIITSVSAFYGYYAKGNSLEVGAASTRAVVVSSVVIMIFNLILTQILLI